MCPRLNFIQYIYNVLSKQQQQSVVNLWINSFGSVALEKKKSQVYGPQTKEILQ